MLPRERFDYSAIIDRPKLKLPGDARVVVWTIVNVEEWDIANAIPRGVLPAPAGASVLPDVANWSWHEYGMRVGFWRIKAALDRAGIKATTAINGSVCESYPRIATAMKDSGWEFMGHGFKQQAMHLAADQAAVIRQTIDAIRDFTDAPPRGWLGPGLTETEDTPEILANAGIEYICDWVMDDQPCVIKTRSKPLVMIPYSLEINDIPMMVIQHHESRVLYERTIDQFERLYEEGKDSARVMAICVHPYISGVPHRIKYFEKIYEDLATRPGVFFWTGEQILDWYREAAPKT
jgi:allantoinase